MSNLQYDYSSVGGGADATRAAPSSSAWIPSPQTAVPGAQSGTGAEASGPTSTVEAETRYKGLHPAAAFFHLFFKVIAIVLFLFGTLFLSSVFVFILTILCLSFDFWTTKNITGRLLVSLRWWTEIDENGGSRWVFESSPDAEEGRVNAYDRWLFWTVLGVNTGVWIVLTLFNMMSLSRLPITIMAVALNMINVVGYTKTRREKARLAELVFQQAASRPAFMQRAAAAMFS